MRVDSGVFQKKWKLQKLYPCSKTMTTRIVIITGLFHFYIISVKYLKNSSRIDSNYNALIDLTETIRKALDDNEFACGVFLDFKKEFDMVNHKILLKKLEHSPQN